MPSPIRTHHDWQLEFERLQDLSAREPARAVAGFVRLARAIEKAMPEGVNDWHLAQTFQQLSLAYGRAGDHAAAAATLHDLAAHHATLAVEHRRAQIAALSASAVHLHKAGSRAGALARLRQAERAAQGLRPQDEILRLATRLLRAPRRAGRGTRARVKVH